MKPLILEIPRAARTGAVASEFPGSILRRIRIINEIATRSHYQARKRGDCATGSGAPTIGRTVWQWGQSAVEVSPASISAQAEPFSAIHTRRAKSSSVRPVWAPGRCRSSSSRRGVLAAGVAAPSLYGLGAFAAPAWSLPPVSEVNESEHVWIPMADGVRLSARLFVPAGAEEDARARGAGIHPLPQARRLSQPRHGLGPPAGRPGHRLCARRRAGHRQLRGGDGRRIRHPRAAGRCGDHRLDLTPALVFWRGGDARHLLGRDQHPAGGLDAAQGARGR